MAIRTEALEINGRSFTRTYSDEYRYVVRDGVAYEDAIDPTEFGRTYEEGDLIPEYTEEADPRAVLEVLLGGAV